MTSKRTGPKPHHWTHWAVPEPNSGCWLWVGQSSLPDGRATLIRHVNGVRRNMRVARLVWEETYGPIPDDRWVLHHCNMASCVNPEHLYLGTHRNNMADMARSGVQKRIRKTHCPRGHPYDLRYSYPGQSIHQVCSICNRESCRAYYLKRKNLVAEATK